MQRAGYNMQSVPSESTKTVQGNFSNTMSHILSNYVNKFGQDPLKSRADRFQLGITGGATPANQVSDTLYFPQGVDESHIVPTKKRKHHQQKPKGLSQGRKQLVGAGKKKKKQKGSKSTPRKKASKKTTHKRKRTTKKKQQHRRSRPSMITNPLF